MPNHSQTALELGMDGSRPQIMWLNSCQKKRVGNHRLRPCPPSRRAEKRCKEGWRGWGRSSTGWTDLEQRRKKQKITKEPPAHCKSRRQLETERLVKESRQLMKAVERTPQITHSKQGTSSPYYVICIWQKW